MDLYLGLGFSLAVINKYATDTNQVKCIEICDCAINTFKNYTLSEFCIVSAEIHTDNPIILVDYSMKEKYGVLYEHVKKELNKNDDQRLAELNSLLSQLTHTEEDELLDVITKSLSNPGKVLYNLQ